MGIWRQNTTQKRSQAKESYSFFENSDPFESDDSFLGTFRPASPSPQSFHRPPANKASERSTLHSKRPLVSTDKDLLDADFSRLAKTRSSRNLLKYSVLALALTTVGFALAKYRPWAMWGSPELVYAYFEVRAVDGAGRPVAGASVKNAGKKVGTTDSFGEWRRYMRVPLGATVPLTISKATTGEPLYAIKNFAVPPEKPEKSDMELRASVQLQTGTGVAVAAAAPMVTTKDANAQAAKNAPNDTLVGSQTSPAAAPAAAAPPVEAKQEVSTAAVVASEATSSSEAETQAQTGSESDSATFTSSHEAIWFEVGSAHSNSVLQQSILPALVQRARELGLRVDQRASWHVRLNSLMDPPRAIGADGAGLIEITTTDQTHHPRQFLRNYQSDPKMTVKGILYGLSHQVNKNIAVYQKDQRWVAMLPKESSELWRIAGGMSLTNGTRESLVSTEAYADAKFRGYYLSSSENPCGSGKTNCELKTRSFAETPAVASWTRLKLRMTTASKEKDSMKVFVSGYEAHPTGDNVLEYWGQDHAKANVTIVQNGKLVLRTQIFNDMRQTATVAVASASVSRR